MRECRNNGNLRIGKDVYCKKYEKPCSSNVCLNERMNNRKELKDEDCI